VQYKKHEVVYFMKKEEERMPTINMLSSADKIKGQGVSSAYIEQVNLVKEGLKHKYDIKVNCMERCDIMHYHTIDFHHYLSVPFAKFKGVTVGYVHFLPETVDNSLDIPWILKKIFYRYMIDFYDSMDYLVTVNPVFIKELTSYGIESEKITYIPNFVSEEQFHTYSKDHIKRLREQYEISEQSFVVLGVGQVQTRKGIVDFIEVAKSLPEIQFIWAGGFSFGALTDGYKELKKVVEHPPSNVKFVGIVDRSNMNDIYNLADVMFLPSYSELFPMTILESMNCKLPIILRDLDIYPDILFDFYMKESTNQGFIQLIQALRNDQELYKKWSNRSWNGHIFYSRDHVLQMWELFYDKVYKETHWRKIRRKMYEKESI
jgi:1,2-diacylglycerol-3-alpha-glucose alpha-1,2-galactosyltransferase